MNIDIYSIIQLAKALFPIDKCEKCEPSQAGGIIPLTQAGLSEAVVKIKCTKFSGPVRLRKN